MDKYKEYLDFFLSTDIRESFELLDGTGKVMVSAPHSVEQIRDGAVKYAEYGTGVLTKLLYDDLKCPVIYKTYNAGDDANYDPYSPYKEALKEYVKKHHILYVLDLHELSPSREVNLDFGTGKGDTFSGENIKADPSILEKACQVFQEKGFDRIQVDTPFDAAYPYTVSAFIARECDISCLQIEINARLLYDKYEDSRFYDVFEALKKLVLLLNAE